MHFLVSFHLEKHIITALTVKNEIITIITFLSKCILKCNLLFLQNTFSYVDLVLKKHLLLSSQLNMGVLLNIFVKLLHFLLVESFKMTFI